MERSGTNNINVQYLDLNITVSQGELVIKVYNKTDDFNFDVVSFTFSQSNTPIEVRYNTFFSRIIRYGNICTHFVDF